MIFTCLMSPELPGQRWASWQISTATPDLRHSCSLWAEHAFHRSFCGNDHQDELLLLISPYTPSLQTQHQSCTKLSGRSTLIAVLSSLIHRLRKTALYSLQAIDALKGFAEITIRRSLTKSTLIAEKFPLLRGWQERGIFLLSFMKQPKEARN